MYTQALGEYGVLNALTSGAGAVRSAVEYQLGGYEPRTVVLAGLVLLLLIGWAFRQPRY
jgi:hypothetical protein